VVYGRMAEREALSRKYPKGLSRAAVSWSRWRTLAPIVPVGAVVGGSGPVARPQTYGLGGRPGRPPALSPTGLGRVSRRARATQYRPSPLPADDPVVPFACHIQGSIPVLSGQPRSILLGPYAGRPSLDQLERLSRICLISMRSGWSAEIVDRRFIEGCLFVHAANR
jgi:hypothetical protein